MNELWTEQENNFRMNISGTEYEVSTHFDISGRQSLFAGLLYCPDCGAKLHFCTAKSLKPNQEFYRCANYNSGRGTCKIHYIRNVILKEIFWKRSAVWRIMCAAMSRCFCISPLCRITRSIK